MAIWKGGNMTAPPPDCRAPILSGLAMTNRGAGMTSCRGDGSNINEEGVEGLKFNCHYERRRGNLTPRCHTEGALSDRMYLGDAGIPHPEIPSVSSGQALLSAQDDKYFIGFLQLNIGCHRTDYIGFSRTCTEPGRSNDK
jgi:hypothetical protein